MIRWWWALALGCAPSEGDKDPVEVDETGVVELDSGDTDAAPGPPRFARDLPMVSLNTHGGCVLGPDGALGCFGYDGVVAGEAVDPDWFARPPDRTWRYLVHAPFALGLFDEEGAWDAAWFGTGPEVPAALDAFAAPGSRWAAGSDASPSRRCAVRQSGELICAGAAGGFPGGVEWKDVVVGASSACGITAYDQLLCWGGDRSVYEDLPLSRRVQRVAVGSVGACAIDEQGLVVCSGRGAITDVPEDLGTAGAIAAHGAHACAVTTDGELTCWGSPLGELDGYPTGGDFVDVDVSSGYACAVAASGETTCWGAHDAGAIGVHPAP